MRRPTGRSPLPSRMAATAIATISLAALFALAGCSCSVPAPTADEIAVTYSTDERPMSSLELVEGAMRSGALEYSTGLLYKVYVMFEPDSLPPEFASDVPSKCGTPVISEVQRNWNLLSPDDAAEIARYIEPIGMPGESDTQMDDVTPDRLDNEREKID